MKDTPKLKTEYRAKYAKQFKEEEKKEKVEVNKVVKDEKKKVREEFLADFFLPLRQEFEKNAKKYEALWPFKSDDYLPEPMEIEVIYAYDNVVSERKIQ